MYKFQIKISPKLRIAFLF